MSAVEGTHRIVPLHVQGPDHVRRTNRIDLAYTKLCTHPHGVEMGRFSHSSTKVPCLIETIAKRRSASGQSGSENAVGLDQLSNEHSGGTQAAITLNYAFSANSTVLELLVQG